VRSALFCDMTQRILVISYRRFGTSYVSHLRLPKMVPLGCPETGTNYHYTLHNIPE